jgi:hypothetical protein
MSEVELVNVMRLSDSTGTGPPDRLEGSSVNGDLPHDHEATTELVYLDKEGSGAPEVSVHYSKCAHSPEHDEECDGEADRLLYKVRYYHRLILSHGGKYAVVVLASYPGPLRLWWYQHACTED